MAPHHRQRTAVTRQVSVPAESIWFKGHFPGDPLLPGIAQLHMVMDAIRASLKGDIRLTGLKRVRFKRIIRPGEAIAIAADPVQGTPGHYRFELTVAGETACSGLMMTAAAHAETPSI